MDVYVTLFLLSTLDGSGELLVAEASPAAKVPVAGLDAVGKAADLYPCRKSSVVSAVVQPVA